MMIMAIAMARVMVMVMVIVMVMLPAQNDSGGNHHDKLNND